MLTDETNNIFIMFLITITKERITIRLYLNIFRTTCFMLDFVHCEFLECVEMLAGEKKNNFSLDLFLGSWPFF